MYICLQRTIDLAGAPFGRRRGGSSPSRRWCFRRGNGVLCFRNAKFHARVRRVRGCPARAYGPPRARRPTARAGHARTRARGRHPAATTVAPRPLGGGVLGGGNDVLFPGMRSTNRPPPSPPHPTTTPAPTTPARGVSRGILRAHMALHARADPRRAPDTPGHARASAVRPPPQWLLALPEVVF
jgi:hypothetical protein